MDRHEIYEKLDASSVERARLRMDYLLALERECEAIPFPWKWLRSSPALVCAAVMGTEERETITLCSNGDLVVHTKHIIEANVLGALRRQLDIELSNT
jgi:hypothetical protein